MAFKVPSIPRKSIPSIVTKNNIPHFSIDEVRELRQLGSGSFGTVLLASKKNGDQVVIKRIKEKDEQDHRQQRLFYKEAKLLHEMRHSNIVKFLGICTQPCALMLEYLCFDFEPFGSSTKVSSLNQYLSYIDDHDLACEFPLQAVIATDVVKGLKYLHSKNFVHRDLKPGNILVSNNHYSGLRGSQMKAAFQKSPIVCKLTDFGESRSEEVQTATVRNQGGTINVYRGSPVYMAPEIFSAPDDFLASIDDLKKVDIWALGMVLFMIVNPDHDYPYFLEIHQAKRQGKNWKEVLKSKMEKNELPQSSKKYHVNQATDWYILTEVLECCLKHNPDQRPNVENIDKLLKRDDFCEPSRNIPLKCSQSSAIADFHEKMVHRGTAHSAVDIANDGTNSCAFLSIILADALISNEELPTQIDEWEELAQDVSNIVTSAPGKFNHLRDVSLKYDVLEAYRILRDAELIRSGIEFTEEILVSDRVYSPKGRKTLIDGVARLFTMEDSVSVAIYTCGGFTFTIGCKNGQYFIIDTHSIGNGLGGNGNGILKVFSKADESEKRICHWVWKRLKESGVQQNESQSLAIVDTSSCGSLPLHGIATRKREASSIRCSDGKRPKTELHVLGDGASGYENYPSSDESANTAGGVMSRDRPGARRGVVSIDDSDDDGPSGDEGPTTAGGVMSRDRPGARRGVVSIDDGANKSSGTHGLANNYNGKNEKDKSSINGFPVLMCRSRGLTNKEILSIVVSKTFPQDKLCCRVPSMVDSSSVFVVDFSSFDPMDLASDDCGVYGAHSSPSVEVEASCDDDGILTSLLRTVSKEEESEPCPANTRRFIIRRQYSWHRMEKNYKRIIAKVEENGKLLDYAIVQYIIKTQVDLSKLCSKPHGRSKKSKDVYIRTKPSVLQKIRKLGEKERPKRIIAEIEKDAGDICCIPSQSDLPRDRKQVYSQVRKVQGRVRSRSTGPAATPDLSRLLSMQYSGSFVRNVNFALSTNNKGEKRAAPNTFAATDTCLQWVKKFCSGSNPCAVAGVDMTYKLGPFYLTTMTFPNPMFVYKSNDTKSPTTLAAIMTSTTKEKNDYDYMARCLKAEGVKSLTYGMDGECAMEMGFEDVFPINKGGSIHLRCFDHVRDDINQKLCSMGLDDATRKQVITDILGQEYDGNRVKGLVDSESPEEFERLYVQAKKKWPEDFQQWMLSTKGRVRSLKETLKRCMLKAVRIDAGLGNPPNKWSNQRTESINNVIKEENYNQITDQVRIHEIIENNVIKQQEREYIKAIYNTGEYRLAPRYRKYSTSPYDWSRKTEVQRKAHIKRVLGGSYEESNPNGSQQVLPKKLPVDIANCGVTSVSPGLLNQIWHKAEVILSHHHVLDLGSDTFCVTEYGTSTNVSTKQGNLVCICQNYKSTAGLCQHTLAVGERTGKLCEHLHNFNSKQNKASRILTSHTPKRAGDKPKEKKKRKGQNNVQSSPIVCEKGRVDDDIDFAKPILFTEIWHNRNTFQVLFTKNIKKKNIVCEACKIEFPQGAITCIPQDIVIMHMERYHYPKKDDQGNVTMEPTWKKEAARFYCVRKSCILKRHPYFWKGMLTMTEDTSTMLKEGHRKLLREEFHIFS